MSVVTDAPGPLPEMARLMKYNTTPATKSAVTSPNATHAEAVAARSFGGLMGPYRFAK